MSKASFTNVSESTQEAHFIENPNSLPFTPSDETQQNKGAFSHNNAWKIRTYALPKEQHILLHLYNDTAAQKCLAACVSEMFCLLPLNSHSAQAISRIVRLGDIKLQKRLFRIKLNDNASNEEHVGLLILAQVMVPVEVIEEPNKTQINAALTTLKLKSRSFTAILEACECQVRKLTTKEQLLYMKEENINIDDVVVFKNMEELVTLLPDTRRLLPSSKNVSKSTSPGLKNYDIPSDFFHHFFQPTPEKTSQLDLKKTNCTEVS